MPKRTQPPQAQPPTATDPWLRVEDVAAQLDVSTESVRRWLRSGELRGLKLNDKAGWRVRQSDLDTFTARRMHGTPPGATAVQEGSQS